MGRKKIKIQPIKEDRNRSVTYLKRKAGLFKKAHELAVLTDSDVAVIVFGHNGKLAEFCSGDIDQLLLRYTEYDGVAERKGPQHYAGIEKDSDDDDGGGDDDPSGSGPGHDQKGGASSGADPRGGHPGQGNGGGEAGGTGSHNGSKRKANDAGPSSNGHKHAKTAAGSSAMAGSVKAEYDDGADLSAQTPVDKQAFHAALRQRGQGKVNGDLMTAAAMHGSGLQDSAFPPGQSVQLVRQGGMMDASGALLLPRSHSIAAGNGYAGSHPEMAIDGMPRSGSHPQDGSTFYLSGAGFGPMFDQATGMPIVISPATPAGQTASGAGMTGRRSSFSVPGASDAGDQHQQQAPRPMTANAALVPQPMGGQQQMLAPQVQQTGFPGFTPSLALQQQGHDQALQAATAAAAAYAAKGAAARGFSMQSTSSSADPSKDSHLVARPASTGHHRSHHSLGSMTYAQMAGEFQRRSDSSASPTSIKITRPYTASGDYASGHLAPPGAQYGYANVSPFSMHPSSSVSPAPSMQGSSSSTPMMAPQMTTSAGGQGSSALQFSSSQQSSMGVHDMTGTPADSGPTPNNSGMSGGQSMGRNLMLSEGAIPASSSTSTFSSSDSDASLASMVPPGGMDGGGPNFVAAPMSESNLLNATGSGPAHLMHPSKLTMPSAGMMAQPAPVHLGHHLSGVGLSYGGFDDQMLAVDGGFSRR